MTPAPLPTHQFIALEISFHLRKQLENCPQCVVLEEVDYKVNEDTVVRPDVVFTCEKRDKPYLTIAPEIIFEIISPSSARKDEKFKYEIYEKEGDIVKTYEFNETKCKVSLDFEEIFKRLSIIS